MRPHWPSETYKAPSPLTINMVLIGRKWLRSRAGLILEGRGSVSESNVRVKVGSSGGNGGGKADSVSSLPKVPSVSGDDTAPC